MLDLEALWKAAEAATPGPWSNAGYPLKGRDGPEVCGPGDVLLLTMEAHPKDNDNAAYIAAANPAVMLELLALIAELNAKLSTASQFWVPRPTEARPLPMTIDRCAQWDGPDRWAVRCGGDVLSRSGEWEWEPSPSNRDDDFLARCRFGTYDEAKTAADAALKDR